jgi:(p)ppGpp synthase/HD superfamily hydrolase
MNNLAEAIRFAQLAHEGQRRKYVDEPYIRHPLRVMAAVACDQYLGGQEEPAIAAVLHDVVEDCGVEFLDANVWGLAVPRWVDELTNKYTTEAYPDKNRRARKALEFKRLAGMGRVAKTIKLYDRIDNLESWFTPGLVWTDEMVGFGRTYARESWELMMALAEPDLAYLNLQMGTLAAKLRDRCAP